MRIAIFGTGGVGGYFGARLAQAGEDVSFIARGAHLEAIKRDGLRIESDLGNFTITNAQAESDPALVGEVDAVLVGVKGWQVEEAAHSMRRLVGKETIIVPLLNGVDAAPQLAAVYDPPGTLPLHVIGGLCRVSCMIAAPGVIRHAAIEPWVSFNRLDGQADERVEHLRQAFERAGVKVDMPADIQAALWSKLAIMAPFSGLGALTRSTVGELRELPETRRLLQDAIQEVVSLGRAYGINLTPDLHELILRRIDQMAAGTLASMARDMIEGRPSELESQTGKVVRLAAAKNMEVPLNAILYACLLPQEKRVRGG